MDINNRIDHISRETYFDVMECAEMKQRTRECYIRIYNRVKKEWPHPVDWYTSSEKRVRFETRVSDSYWIVWSLVKQQRLPIDFVKQTTVFNNIKILKNTLSDYEVFRKAVLKLDKEYKGVQIKRLHAIILRTCIFLGINNLKKISLEDVKRIKDELVLPNPNTDPFTILNILYYMGYRDTPPGSVLHEGIKANMTVISSSWSKGMTLVIEQFLDNLKNNMISTRKGETEKIDNLNMFAQWYTQYKSIDCIHDLIDLKREDWLEYIAYIYSIENISNKTKYAKLLAFVQLNEWMYVKQPRFMGEQLLVNRDDYKFIRKHKKNNNWAFEKREHGELILKYLLNNFKPKRIEDEFKAAAIIIAGNSGMRRSEIENIPYEGCKYSKDEGVYKIILDYEDKVGQVNRPCYTTKDGYEAIKRLEDLRSKKGNLLRKYNNKVKKRYIHLFEYRGKNPINHTALDSFIKRIKKEIGLFDEEGNVVKGGIHAFRHFYAMTVFKHSGYNIGVVRYLLGHRKYDMSYQYLEEDMVNIISKIRNENSGIFNYAGKGLDTIVEIISGNDKSKSYMALKKILERSKNLSDVLESSVVKKIALGYCLNPCGNESKCINCMNFLITKNEKDKIFKVALDLFSFLCYKVSLFKTKDLALKNIAIQKDISDLYILIEEMNNLNINVNEFYNKLKGIDSI
ncbi:site-specific integrase [Brassicibacter mesophilus]|uniref:site-specific integrase n=1 Tax=Brassicibacter mesophilus TaxID=745119 RepID=UPI003D251CA5